MSGVDELSDLTHPIHWWNASDLRQFLYCPRVIFFRTVVPVGSPATVGMKLGKTAHEDHQRLEKRRQSFRFGVLEAKKVFEPTLRSSKLGLVGMVDMVLVSETEVIPVEMKSGKSGWPGHRLQLAAYGLMAQEEFSLPCSRGFLAYEGMEDNQIEEIKFEKGIFQEVFYTMGKMKELLTYGLMPEPTPIRGRCKDCEYKRHCGDVFE